MEQANLFYTGRRISTENKLLYVYKNKDADKTVHFKKRLIGYEQVGQEITCVIEGGTKYKNCEIVSNEFANKESITAWSIQEKQSLQELENIRASKVKHSAHVDELIDNVRNNCVTASDRKNMALYIYNKLMRY